MTTQCTCKPEVLTEWAHGWERIEPPARVWIPLPIQRKNEELRAALEKLDQAEDMHIQAGTDVTREALGEAAKLVTDIDNELQLMREIWWEHPDAFEDGVTL
jgi:hypothetical protein